MDVFAEQIVHEDYIYQQHKVRQLAISTVPLVWSYCLMKCHDIPLLVENSFSAVLESLYHLLDDNRARPFHAMARQCTVDMIGYVIDKPRSTGTMAALCGVLSERTNLENVNQAR